MAETPQDFAAPALEETIQRVAEKIRERNVVPTGSFVGKILIIEREWVTGRMSVVLVRQPIGF